MEINKLNNKRSYTMRRYIFLFAAFSLFVIGCAEESNILSPVNNTSENEPNWILLPQPDNMNVEATFSTSEWISGRNGGDLELYEIYSGGPFGQVKIEAEAKFKRYSFWGDKYITMTIDDLTGTASFIPSMVFNRDVVYNVTFTGVDLSGINPANVRFAYLATDGSVEYADNDGITVNASNGMLKVTNAKIPHFSRYGFVNKDE